MLCAATEIEGQERAAPATPSAGATLHASVTILPALDAASYAGFPRDLSQSTGPFVRRSTRVVSAPRRNDDGAGAPAWSDPPVARSFERFTHEGRDALRHTIAVLY